MLSGPFAVQSRWSLAAVTVRWPLSWLALALSVFAAWSTVAAHERQGFVVLPNSAPRFVGPAGDEVNVAEILATHEQTGGAFGVWRYTSGLPGGPPLHIHRAEDEFFYVVSGEFNFQLGDCITRAPAGSFVFIPKDVVHTFQNVGPEPGVLMGTVHPGGLEGFFQELPGADAERVKALFKKYHMDVVGPPLAAAARPPISAGNGKPQAKVFRIGVLSPGCHPPTANLDLLLQGLRDLGYAEGQNLSIEWRYSEGRAERFPDMAAELARLPVDLIVAVSTPAALAAKNATPTVPIVMVYVADPVGTGLVTSLARPGGLQSVEVRNALDFEPAFTTITRDRPDALFVVAEVLTLNHRCQVLDFAAQHQLPAMYEFGVFAREGGLMAYGPRLTETFQRGAYYVDQILKAVKPADLPVEQPMNFELVVNFKTAEALGLTLPPHLAALADDGDTGRENGCTRIW
jgi:putative tryptophan/tyrosine transport system substrate-binding protein